MSKKTKPRKSSKNPKPGAVAQQATRGSELSEQQLDNVAGGAFNAFMPVAGGPGDEMPGGIQDKKLNFKVESFSFKR